MQNQITSTYNSIFRAMLLALLGPPKQLIIFRHSHLWEFEREKDLETGTFILMMEVWACSKEGYEREFTISMVLVFSLVFFTQL